MRNKAIPKLGNKLRKLGFDVFDSWYAASEDADDWLRDYEKAKGASYKETLKGHAAQHIFEFDKKHLDRCDSAVLLMPAGRSAFIELGYMAKSKPTFILFDREPERVDIMLNFATEIFFSEGEMLEYLKRRVSKRAIHS